MRNGKLLLFFILVLSTGCGFGAGTHGSIKSYTYPVTKYELQKAINDILLNSSNVKRDSIDNQIFDVTNPEKVDTIHDDYYNDGDNYITIYITEGEIVNEYTVKYAGDSTYWDTSKISHIFIAYAYDGKGNGGSEGNGGFNWKWGFKRKVISIFEEEFVTKIDKQLGISHTESD